MKVLFIASNPENEKSLRLEQEITELQRITVPGSDRTIEFAFLPALPFEELENQILMHKAEVVHIVAHGEPGHVFLATSYETKVALTVQAVKTLLQAFPPKLVYINSCNSHEIARGITDIVPFAIGTIAEISNFGARKGAVNFYRAISLGRSLVAAFRSAAETVAIMHGPDSVQMVLEPTERLDSAEYVVLFEPTRLVARFLNHQFRPDEKGNWAFELGVAGCPATTVQAVICTDEETFVPDHNEPDPVEHLCSVVITTSRRGEVWLNEPWSGIYGDIRLYAVVIGAGGRHVTARATLAEALENYYGATKGLDAAIETALHSLRDADGSIIRASLPGRRGKRT
ncbi:hypothetical protein NKH85_12545 [Mesorhizobium sp. M0924]|uniref:hypothetical protein n=1 Tax=unclassified Mesorhizobium TaxID=325217 RepID=UPI0033365382